MQVDIDHVTKNYATRHGRVTVLDDVCFTVRRGEHYGVLGRNGSGKSTLIRLLSGIETPTSGHIHRDMSVSWPMAFTGTFQRSLTGLDNLRFVARVYGKDAREMQPFVEDFAELGAYFREPVETYSSGMTARLAFALSLAVNFDCFLIDEVIAVGDDRFQQKCQDELFVKRKDHALVIVSHDPNVIRTYCSKAAVLDRGRLATYDSVDDAYAVYSDSRSSLVP